MDIAAAHWRGEERPHPCGTCTACPETTCFVFPESLHYTHPGLVKDLQFCLHMLGVSEVEADCPRKAADAYDQKSAA